MILCSEDDYSLFYYNTLFSCAICQVVRYISTTSNSSQHGTDGSDYDYGLENLLDDNAVISWRSSIISKLSCCKFLYYDFPLHRFEYEFIVTVYDFMFV